MAIDEAAFDSALAEFVSTLDSTLTAIQTKLDEIGEPVDFSDELATLDGAKTRLQEFVDANTTPTEPSEPTDQPPGSGTDQPQ